LDALAVDADIVARGIHLGAKLGYHSPVDCDPALPDQLLRLATRGNPGVGQNFL
jgi:hypothetical protein